MRMTRHFGHRATLLILFGILWVGTGAGVLSEPAGPPMMHTAIPTNVRVGLWVATGVVALFAGFRRSPRDAIGWVALYAMPTVRCVSYFVAWIDYLADPDPDMPVVGPLFSGPGLERGWIFGCTWLVIVLVIVVCSGWREDDIPSRATPKRVVS